MYPSGLGLFCERLDELLEMKYWCGLFCSFYANLVVKWRFFLGLLIMFVLYGRISHSFIRVINTFFGSHKKKKGEGNENFGIK